MKPERCPRCTKRGVSRGPVLYWARHQDGITLTACCKLSEDCPTFPIGERLLKLTERRSSNGEGRAAGHAAAVTAACEWWTATLAEAARLAKEKADSK